VVTRLKQFKGCLCGYVLLVEK